MSEPEESKEDVPNTLPDDQQQSQEETLEKKSETGDKKETDEKIQEEDENAPAASPDQDNVEGDYFEESKADDANEPKTILGMTEESETNKVDISGENQAPENVPLNEAAERVSTANTLTPRTSEVRKSKTGSKLSTRNSIESGKLQEKDWDRTDSLGTPTVASSRKMSRTRQSISYIELGRRIHAGNEEDDDFIEFDLGIGDNMIVLDDVVEEEEQSIAIEEQELSRLDREPYYERHDKAMAEIAERKIRNLILQKKLAMYFKRKKMDYVTKEIEWSYDQQKKYNKKLEVYGELMELDTNEKTRINEEIREAKQTRDNRFRELNNMFKKMQNREAEIGYGLIYRKTGISISDKLVNRLLKRQNDEMEQASSMRLTYIKLKEMVQEKLDAINDINEVAPGLFLADYEQLKAINQSYADKIEEKDEELTKLRTKCSSTTQTLAHLREKTAALENDYTDLVQARGHVDYSFFDIRGNLNHTKQQRDSYRHNIRKIRDESGLLTQPTLLRDMEKGLTDAKVLQTNLDQLMSDHRKREKLLETIRQKIEEAKEYRRSQKFTCKMNKSLTSAQFSTVNQPENIYKGRPSLMIPVILDNEFECLKSIKPLITTDRRKHNKFTSHM